MGITVIKQVNINYLASRSLISDFMKYLADFFFTFSVVFHRKNVWISWIFDNVTVQKRLVIKTRFWNQVLAGREMLL